MQNPQSTSKRNVLSLLFAICCFWMAPVMAESPDQTLINLLDEFLAGASGNDVAAHERFWSEDLVYTSSTGDRRGKAEIMAAIQQEAGEGESADQGPAMEYSREALLVRVYGDAAVVTFRLVAKQPGESEKVSYYYNTGTFLLRDGEWRAIAWQATRIPDES